MTTGVIDRTYARATLYRLLALGSAYPDEVARARLIEGAAVAEVAASMLDSNLHAKVCELKETLVSTPSAQLQQEFGRLFTFSASPDCPLNECAYSAKHIYQETQVMADIAGFYRAFGLQVGAARVDELSAELEFCAYLTLKDARARENSLRAQGQVCRDAHRVFLHDHLGRWAENIGRRMDVLSTCEAYRAFGRLLASYIAYECERLGATPLEPYQEVPNPPEPLSDEGCEEALGSDALDLQDDNLIAELAQVQSRR